MDKDFDKEKPSEPDQAAGEFPEPPDPRKVHELREKMNRERRSRSEHKSPAPSRLVDNAARRAKDIGAYTLIPMLMLAGPAVGYVLGLMVQNRWGGEPWVAVVGMLLGLVAGFRQVFLLLARFGKQAKKKDRDDDR